MPKETKHKILVIDDHVVMREIIHDILDDQGYETIALEDTSTAMDILATGSISLLLLDITMPHESGYDFLVRMKKDRRCMDVPVIFMTGKDDINDKIYGFELGAVDYIVKPFHRMDILMRVKAHLKLVEAHVEQKNKLKQISQAHNSFMKDPATMPKARFGVYFESFQEAGGDFYDVIKLKGMGSYAYFIADISGHDIATSYIMPAIQTLLSEMLKSSENLEGQLVEFNNSVRKLLPDGKFITAQLLLIDRLAGKADIINMGHTPIIYMPAGGEAQSIESPCDILGVHDQPEFNFHSVEIKAYDRFVMYTDGLLESYEKRRVWSECLGQVKDEVSSLAEAEVSELGDLLAKKLLDDDVLDDVLILSIEI